ncbi:hypothetical protein RRG08_023592, partial [Elysia crispata]
MSRRNGVRGRCTNWQTGREAEKRGDQDRQRQGTRGKTKAGDGTEEDKEGEIQTGVYRAQISHQFPDFPLNVCTLIEYDPSHQTSYNGKKVHCYKL